MDHVLDNPAWNALISGNSNLAKGTGEVKYFDTAVSPFVGLVKNTPENLPKLYQQVPHSSPVGFINPGPIDLPAEWKVLSPIPCLQMIYERQASTENITADIIPLTEEHVPQMLALTKLTNPGPFAPRTIEFGHYRGIFDATSW